MNVQRSWRNLMTVARLLWAALSSWSEHRGASMGAAIAFYTLFSMGPVLIIAISIAGWFYGENVARSELLNEVGALMGPNATAAVAAVIDSSAFAPTVSWQALIAIGTSVFAATTVFNELKSSLDVIWGTRRHRHGTVFQQAKARLLSFGIVVSTGFILLVSLLLSTALTLLQARYAGWFGEMLWLMDLAGTLLTSAVVTLLFAAIYKLLPDQIIPWRDVWLSAVITAALYMAGKTLLTLYLGTTAVGSAYGAAGALVLVLVWIFYAAQIFLYGAELAHQVTLYRRRQQEERQHRAALERADQA
ncbi:YihY/virulence factor BrkB family protein [Chitinolyticbacter meiyuanensis]|uniref:YihY/virulence factor BrkB family protein n=1 Tax=Chitinolyticbacter meiyuanensis TaxID=682798 RepID=UPI0011E5CD38|nr:YihY/virulence factor BrkB family protein [Chitinolyticbacter meiyuanensis]